MEQVLWVKAPVQVGVWGDAKAKVEAGWADLSQQGRAEIAYAQAAAQRLPIQPDSLAIK
jgi:hypothetical protein